MVNIFMQILDMSITASYVILAVMGVRLLLRKAPKKYAYAMWIAPLFRLLCPVSIQSVASAFNFSPMHRAASQTGGELQFIPREVVAPPVSTEIPAVNTTAPVVDSVIEGTVPVMDTAVSTPLPSVVPETVMTPMQALFLMGMIAWIIGMTALVTISVVNYIKLRKDLRFATRMEGNVWQCETVRSPFLVGLIKPKIYLPYGLDDKTQEYILAHERYHLKRFDHIAKLLGYAALTIHWFNPLCHLAFRLMNGDMEMSCDEYVLERNNIPTTQYSYSLLTIATNRRFPAATPLAFAETGVKERMINVLKWKKPKKWVSVVAVMVCTILLISCATNPKVKNTTGDDPAVEDTQTALLEFPGLKWGMTPEEVIAALELTKEQIVVQRYSEGDENESTCRLSVKNTTFLDEEVSLAAFQFRNNGKGYKLHRIDLYLDEDADMNEMNNALTEVYGEGTGEYYLNYHIDVSGKLQEGKRRGDTELGQQYNMYTRLPEKLSGDMQRKKDAVFGIVEDPEFMAEHWVSSATGTEVLPEDGQELFVQFFEETEQADRETVMAWFEKVPLVAIITQNRSLAAAMHEIDDSPSEESAYVTHNQVIFDAGNLIYFIEGIERLTPVGDPALLEFPGVKWFVTPEELKEALNITADQILNEATELDRIDTANDYDRYMLTVTDLVLFGRKVTYAYFEFRRDPGYDFEFINARLMLEEDTDMDKLKEDMVEIYGPGAGENYSFYLYSYSDYEKTEHTLKSRMDSQLEYFAKSGAHLKGLEGNPFRDVLDDPEYKTHIWVNENSCDILPEESVEELGTRMRSANQDAAPDDKELTEMLDQMPMIHIAITNRCATTVYRNVMGTVDEMTPYYTYNYVEFNANSLAEYRRIAEQKSVTVPSTEEVFLLEFPGLKWGASVEEVKTALNIQEEQISTDRFSEGSTVDTHYLHVKDITFFGEEVPIASFKFRSVDEENVGLCYIMLFLDEDTDMDRFQDVLSYYYRNQGTGEYFDTCKWEIKDEVNFDPDADRRVEYELVEGKSRGGDAELWYLADNPPSGSGFKLYEAVRKIIEDPEFKTYNWVSSVKPRVVVKSEGLDALKTIYERNLGIDPSVTDRWLEKRPLVWMSISNRSLQAARAEVEGATDEELALCTNNVVYIDAQTLIELQYETQRLQKVLESE